MGATVYELASGRNIAGNWLGMGELFQPDLPESTTPKKNQEVAGVSRNTVDSFAIMEATTGHPESPIYIPSENPTITSDDVTESRPFIGGDSPGPFG